MPTQRGTAGKVYADQIREGTIMASNITGIKTGAATSMGMPKAVTAAIKRGVPKHQALTMGPKPMSSVHVR